MKKKVIEITFGGEKRPLAWDNEALLDYEEAATFRMADGTVVKASGLEGVRLSTTREIVAAVYACLCAGAREQNTPAPTFNQVRKWIFADDGTLEQIAEEAMGVITANSPNAEDVGEIEGDDGTPDPPMATGSEAPTPTPS